MSGTSEVGVHFRVELVEIDFVGLSGVVAVMDAGVHQRAVKVRVGIRGNTEQMKSLSLS